MTTFTLSQDMTYNNWGITFSNPEPPRLGYHLARKRLKAILEKNGPITQGEPTRQTMRAHYRKMKKEALSRRKRELAATRGGSATVTS